MTRSGDWAHLLEVQRVIQRHFPEAVLVGGTAAALHAHHRVSLDVDSVLTDLRSNFPEVLRRLEELAGWRSRRLRPPVLVLGQLEGVDVGIRQLRRALPLETQTVDGILVPTLPEMLRVKGWLVVTRNALRDYLDFCALADTLGSGVEQALADMHTYYPQPDDADPTLLQLAKQLAEPKPYDVADGGPELTDWRELQPPWTDWDYVQGFCRRIAGRLMHLILDPREGEPSA
jgi:hypothetical protein